MSCRRVVCALLMLLVAIVGASGAVAAGPAPMFRVFLKTGAPLVCWGEYARVGDRLVLTVPIGDGPRTAYEFVSIPVSRVDMDRTERYAEAVRAAQFAASRGRAEYAELSRRLSAELALITTLPDSKARLASAEGARQQLIDWAAGTHGYRAAEVQQLLQLFDSAIIDLRVAAGESRFSINLSATGVPATPVRLRAAPTARESIDLAVKAAAAADSADVRRALLRRARAAAAALPKSDPRNVKLKETVDREFAKALRIDLAYRRLDLDVRRLAASAVEKGDVMAFDSLRVRVTRTDRLLGRQRPEDMAALLASLEESRDAAAEQRLVLDHWETLRVELAEYQQDIAPLVKTLDRLAPTLKAIGAMSGPALTELVTAERETAAVVALFANLVVPEGMATVHSLLGLAIEQADLAVRTRHRAVELRQLPVARDAAAAAADAMVRLAQAKTALSSALRPPKAIR